MKINNTPILQFEEQFYDFIKNNNIAMSDKLHITLPSNVYGIIMNEIHQNPCSGWWYIGNTLYSPNNIQCTIKSGNINKINFKK